METLYKKARQFAIKAHKNQYRKGTVNGRRIPFVWHPLDVASRCDTPEKKAIACLHDVVEDTSYTLEDLRREGFPEFVVVCVGRLTRSPNITYFDYIQKQIIGDQTCEEIKEKDIWSNFGTLTAKMLEKGMYRRYMKALLLIKKISL